MTSIWDIIAERLGFMLVLEDLVWIPFTFSIKGWLLMINKPEFTTAAVIANFLNQAGIWYLEELTSKNMYLRRIPKHLYEVSLQRSLGESSLLAVSGKTAV